VWQYGFTERLELSGYEPQRDVRRPGEEPPAPTLPPGLVFKPDARQAARVARARTYTLLAAAILMIAGLILLIFYHPVPTTRPNDGAPTAAVAPAESVIPPSPQASSQPAVETRSTRDVDIARSAVTAIDTLVSAAAEKWVRANALMPQGTVTHDGAQQAAQELAKAVILADSARHDIALARQQAELVRAASREVESGGAFRMSVLYAAMDRYLKSLDDDAADRRAYYAKSEASVEAVLADDQAESETQQNVAMSYLRHSEDMQPGIKRLAEQMREAQHNIENATR
jgi:hypothetical protein